MPAKMLPEESQCLSKFKHTWESAHRHKAALGYRGMEVYKCPWCGCVHCGHGTKRKKVYRRVKYRAWMIEA